MSLSERPQAWCTPMGLLAVIGPSRNDHRGPLAVCARSLWKMRCSSQKRRIWRSMAGKSGTLGTDRYIFMGTRRRKGSAKPEKPILASPALQLRGAGGLLPPAKLLFVPPHHHAGPRNGGVTAYSTDMGFAMRFEASRISKLTMLPPAS